MPALESVTILSEGKQKQKKIYKNESPVQGAARKYESSVFGVE